MHPIGNLRQGENVFTSDWDLCVILDACRYDLLLEVAGKYSFLSDPTSKISVDSKTDAWTRKTFSRADVSHLENTTYVTANPFSRQISEPANLHSIDHVWQYGWDNDNGTVLSRIVTDRAISASRNGSQDSLLVHYLQPHIPFVPWEENTPLGRGNFGLDGRGTKDTWLRLRDSELTAKEVWDGYRQNLRHVLDEVALLLNNVNAKSTVITFDHGNGLGEWGIFGYPIHTPFDRIRKVPWVETKAVDQGTYTPSQYDVEKTGSVTEKLREPEYV